MSHLPSCKVTPLCEEKKFYSIDVLRFLMAVMIMYYHLTGVLKGYFPALELFKVRYTLLTGVNVVISFFIMSGFFLFWRERC